MIKNLLWCFLLSTQISVALADDFSSLINVNSTKSDGKSWDASGGAPDILLKINGSVVAFKPECKDTYQCTINFQSVSGKSWYFEIFDKDLFANDLISKGECGLDKTCNLGSARIQIIKQTQFKK